MGIGRQLRSTSGDQELGDIVRGQFAAVIDQRLLTTAAGLENAGEMEFGSGKS